MDGWKGVRTGIGIVCALALVPLGGRGTQYTTVELERFGDAGIGSGRIHYYLEETDGPWELIVELDQLQPAEPYRLSLNAMSPDSRESQILGNLKIEGWPEGGFYLDPKTGRKEGYWDFKIITTDEKGTFSGRFLLPLSSEGDGYTVKFLVKERYLAEKVLLQAKPVRFVVKRSARESSLTWIRWGLLAVAIAIVIGLLLLLRRRMKPRRMEDRTADTIEEKTAEAQHEPTAATRRIKSWKDLAIGIEYDAERNPKKHWAIPPNPQPGRHLQQGSCVELALPPGQMPTLLKLLCESTDGKTADREQLAQEYGYYAEVREPFMKTYQKMDIDPKKLREALKRGEAEALQKQVDEKLKGAVGNLSRRLRNNLIEKSMTVPNQGPFHADDPSHVSSDVVVCELREAAGRLSVV